MNEFVVRDEACRAIGTSMANQSVILYSVIAATLSDVICGNDLSCAGKFHSSRTVMACHPLFGKTVLTVYDCDTLTTKLTSHAYKFTVGLYGLHGKSPLSGDDIADAPIQPTYPAKGILVSMLFIHCSVASRVGICPPRNPCSSTRTQ